MSRKRIAIGLSDRFRIFQRDDFRCQYCGARAPHVELHIDHIIPVSQGGSNGATNLLTACADCNLGKHTRRAHRYEERGRLYRAVRELNGFELMDSEDGPFFEAMFALLWEMDLLAEAYERTRDAHNFDHWMSRMANQMAEALRLEADYFAARGAQ